MEHEAEITVNGARLTETQSRMVRLALATFADLLAKDFGFKDDGISLTDQYQTDIAYVEALIDGRDKRPR
jgi:hypothetical protein